MPSLGHPIKGGDDEGDDDPSIVVPLHPQCPPVAVVVVAYADLHRVVYDAVLVAGVRLAAEVLVGAAAAELQVAGAVGGGWGGGGVFVRTEL